MAICDECGNDALARAQIEGQSVLECGLCGAITGDDPAVTAVLAARQARERGFDPSIYALVQTLEQLGGLSVVAADPGDPDALVWPFVQLAVRGAEGWRTVESVVQSLALSAAGQDVHWVLELEYRRRLVLTLKPRFHRRPGEVTATAVRDAQRDLGRVQRNLAAHARLSWWSAS